MQSAVGHQLLFILLKPNTQQEQLRGTKAFVFILFLAYSLRDYSSLWQGRHKSKSVRQLSHCACSQDMEG